MWRIPTNSLHVRNYQRILHMCEDLVPVLHMYEELVPILHIREKVAPSLHMFDEYLPILHTSEIINMRNLSTNFRPQNLSKLTIGKFYIWQMWRIGTSSSYGCEIYEMRNLRFNIALLQLILPPFWKGVYWEQTLSFWRGGRVVQLYRVSYVTEASNWYWLTIGQALLSL